jgi:Putative auto-transporter adhesin, head GIN domain
MKNILFSLLAVWISSSLNAQKSIDDPNAEVRTITSFHALSVSDAFDVYLTQGDDEALVVSASETKYLDRIKTSVENGVLIIRYDRGNFWKEKFWKGDGGKKLKAYVSFKMLDRMKISGACDVFVTGSITATDLQLDVSGASDFKKVVINANSLTVNLNGASDIYVIGGKVNTLRVEAHGASDFHGYDLQTDNCTAEAHGASDIRITVNKELNARASGASGILYKGEGVIRDMKSSGASSVSKRG